jgi:WhiB family redox-sensing transcriptional regulator
MAARPGHLGLSTLAGLIDRPAWVKDAACLEHPDLSWYPDRGADVREQKRICDGCLVRVECHQAAIDNDERHGIWGGVSATRLHRDRHTRREAA